MHRTFCGILVSAVATIVAACSTGAATSDSNAGDGGVLYRLGSGTYIVSVATTGSTGDQCQLNFKTGDTFYLTLDNATGIASLGSSPSACTADYGCGTIANNQGVLTTMVPPASGCSMRKTIMTAITLIEDLTFTIELTETQTERTGCADNTDCTSTFTLTLVRPDAGTNAAD